MDSQQKHCIAAHIADMLRPTNDPQHGHIYSKETHVTERLSDDLESFDCIIYCEDSKCAFKVHYEEAWKDGWLGNFLSKRIASNVTLVCWVFNIVQTPVDEKYMEIHKVRSLWQRAATQTKDDEKLVDGTIECSSLARVDKKGDQIQYVHFDFEDEEHGKCVYLFGVSCTLLAEYGLWKQDNRCRFDVVGVAENEIVLRIHDRETDELLAVLSPATTTWMPRDEYDTSVRMGLIWEEEAVAGENE